MKQPLRIIFMGTPGFAVPSLDILVREGYNIVGAIAAPDKPAGRGLQVQKPAVKQYAEEKGLRVLQPEKLKNPGFLNELHSLKADLQVVVAFRMLPEVVWSMPPLGTFNLHASLLPDYRGAAPINWAIINGERLTGLTTFFLQHQIDTGDIILQKEIPIGPAETAGELHDRMAVEGAELVLRTVRAIERGEAQTHPQRISGTLKEAPKIFKETSRISWEQPLENIFNHIRGLSPYPAAWTTLEGKVFKIYKADKEEDKHSEQPGLIETDDKTYMKAAVPGGFIRLLEVQLEGKRKMGIDEFLCGYHAADKALV